MNLLDALPRAESNKLTGLYLAPSGSWGHNGGWTASAPGFNWSAIDGIEIVLSKEVAGGRPCSVSVAGISLLPVQRQANVAIVFDDGYQSILSAAGYMRQHGMPGNIAVIGKYVDNPAPGYLNVYQLKQLQNQWGWDMVNHTQQHVDAVAKYLYQNNLDGYSADILKQAAWLEANGLDSAPNWFIYPHGTTGASLERVVGRYYMFARVTANNPDGYPYGNSRDVTDLEIKYPGDIGDGGSARTTQPSAVATAINAAAEYHTTLILTFHRIHATASDPVGYPLRLFEQIVNDIQQSGVKVLTLSQIDQSNGIPLSNHVYYQPAQPAQLTAQIHASGGAAPTGGWNVRSVVLVVAGLLLLISLAMLIWALFFTGGAKAPSSGPATASCTPEVATPSPSAADHYDELALSLDPVLYLPLADPNSKAAADLSASSMPAVNEPGIQPLGAARLPNGDRATVFDGAGQYVQVPSDDALSIPNTGCLSVVAWVRPDVLQFPSSQGTGYVYILGKGTTGQDEYALRMYSHANTEKPERPNRVSAYVFNLRGGLGSGAYFQDPVTPGEWMMVAFVVDSRRSAEWPDGYVAIYKDGKLRGGPVSLSQFHVTPQDGNAPFRIATRDLKSYFEGAIGKVAVYGSVLTDQQLHAMYTAMTAISN
jgi:peptidoglycan/xylan/chitin deacetylase (PgdA/CDA1 family)